MTIQAISLAIGLALLGLAMSVLGFVVAVGWLAKKGWV